MKLTIGIKKSSSAIGGGSITTSVLTDVAITLYNNNTNYLCLYGEDWGPISIPSNVINGFALKD